MATEEELRYLITVQDRELRDLKKELRDTNKIMGTGVPKAARRAGGGFSRLGGVARGVGRVVKYGLIGAVAGIGVAAAKTGKDLARIERLTAQTEAVIKSTGGVANVTTEEVLALADGLEKMSGVEAETIQEGQNMLLTFKQVRNELGEGNDIFDQATRATLDLSIAMGTDMRSASIMVGKALNDPIRGLTAMRRVGIQFTDAQEEQIKTLVESGKTMEAQKLILRELESQFGGSAKAAGKTFGGQMQILGHRLGEASERIMVSFMPALLGVARFITRSVVPRLERLGGFIEDVFRERTFRGKARVVLTGLGSLAQDVWDAIFEPRNVRRRVEVRPGRMMKIVTQDASLAHQFTALVGDAIESINWEEVGRQIRKGFLTVWEGLEEEVNQALDNPPKPDRTWWQRITDTIDPTVDREAKREKIRGFFKGIAEDAGDFLDLIGTDSAKAATRTAHGWSTAYVGVKTSSRDSLTDVRRELRATRGSTDSSIDRVEALRGQIRNVKGKDVDVNANVRVKFHWPSGTLSDAFDRPGDSGGPHALDLALSKGVKARLPRSGTISVLGMPRRDVNSALWPALGLASAAGLTISSTYRPGATVRGSGAPSDHGVFPSKAIDVAGNASAMRNYALAVAGLRGVDTVIYSPLGLAANGSRSFGPIASAATYADHFSHVHVDTFDVGGRLRTGWTLARNLTGHDETVLPITPERFARTMGGGDVHNHYYFPSYVGSRRDLERWLDEIDKAKSRRGDQLRYAGSR